MMTTEQFLFSVLSELASTAAQTAAFPSWDDAFARKEVREVWRDEEAPLRRPRERRVTIEQISSIPQETLLRLRFTRWDETLMLIPLWVFHYIENGEKLTGIHGVTETKTDKFDDFDVRGGCIAFGFARQQEDPTP